jgi:hypothetical protein
LAIEFKNRKKNRPPNMVAASNTLHLLRCIFTNLTSDRLLHTCSTFTLIKEKNESLPL